MLRPWVLESLARSALCGFKQWCVFGKKKGMMSINSWCALNTKILYFFFPWNWKNHPYTHRLNTLILLKINHVSLSMGMDVPNKHRMFPHSDREGISVWSLLWSLFRPIDTICGRKVCSLVEDQRKCRGSCRHAGGRDDSLVSPLFSGTQPVSFSRLSFSVLPSLYPKIVGFDIWRWSLGHIPWLWKMHVLLSKSM